MEEDYTLEEARAFINSKDFQPYGKTRMYGVIEGGLFEGQVNSIKSEYQLNNYNYSRIYSK